MNKLILCLANLFSQILGRNDSKNFIPQTYPPHQDTQLNETNLRNMKAKLLHALNTFHEEPTVDQLERIELCCMKKSIALQSKI